MVYLSTHCLKAMAYTIHLRTYLDGPGSDGIPTQSTWNIQLLYISIVV